MSVSEYLHISGVLIGILAAIYSTVIYIQAHYRTKSIGSGTIATIGGLNFAIFLSMGLILVSSPANNTPSSLTLLSILFIGIFIFCQTIYLLTPWSPVRLFRLQQQSKNQSVPQKNEDLDEVCFRLHLQSDAGMNTLRIFDMSFPLDTTEMYIPTKVYPEPLQFSTEQIEKLEEQFTPLDLLNEKLKILEKRKEGAIDLFQIIEHRKHCILLGEPGTGKTTYLKFLTIHPPEKKEGDTEKFLPLNISLNDYVNSRGYWNKKLFEYIVEFYGGKWLDLPEDKVRKIVKSKLEDGSAIVLLDGLDETVVGNNPEETYTRVWNNISAFVGEYEKTCIIVTTRKASYELRKKLIVSDEKISGNKFESVEMAGFLRDDVRKFVRNWLRKITSHEGKIRQDENTQMLLLKLEQDSRLRELSNNPLLLSIITLAYTRKLNISDRRAHLYDECISALLKDWDKSKIIQRTNETLKDIQNQLSELKIDILKELAWHIHYDEHSHFSKEYALAIIEKLLEDKKMPFNLKEQILRGDYYQ